MSVARHPTSRLFILNSYPRSHASDQNFELPEERRYATENIFDQADSAEEISGRARATTVRAKADHIAGLCTLKKNDLQAHHLERNSNVVGSVLASRADLRQHTVLRCNLAIVWMTVQVERRVVLRTRCGIDIACCGRITHRRKVLNLSISQHELTGLILLCCSDGESK